MKRNWEEKRTEKESLGNKKEKEEWYVEKGKTLREIKRRKEETI